MIILTLDTSGPSASVAILDRERIRYSAVVQNRLTHSESIMPMTEDALLRAGLDVSDVDYFAAVTGPGSFTGVRIGVTTVRAMAHAANRPCIAVNALEAFARHAAPFDGLICPMQDARAGQVYAAVFSGLPFDRLTSDEPIKLTEFLSKVSELSSGRSVLFTGDGMVAHQAEIMEIYPGKCCFASPDNAYLHPEAAALLALENIEKAVPYQELHPYYLRPPQAVRQKNLVENAAHV